MSVGFTVPWAKQPQFSAPLNVGHPFARGIVGYITPWDKGASVGTPTFSPRVNTNGPAIAHLGNGSSYLVKDVVGSITQDCSILVVANVGNIAGGGHIASIGTTSAGDQVFTLQSGPEFAATLSSIRGIIRATSGGGVTSAESRTYAAGVSGQRLENFLAVYNGTGAMKLYLNGYDDTLSNAFTAATGAVSSFNRVSLGGTDRGTDVFAGTGQNQALVVAWNRALSPAEALELSRNPWQLFTPLSRRLWVGVAASGSPTGTLATTNANDTLAASGSAVGFTGTLARTNANDTLAGVGTQTNTGTLATTNANDVLAGIGYLAATGTLSYINANDSLSAEGSGPAASDGGMGRDIRKRVWIDGEPYDIPVDALGDVERWMPKKALKKAAKEKRIPRIEVIGRTNDGVEARQEVKQEEWPVMAQFLTQATFVTPGILDFAAFEEARKLLRRRKILTLLLMAA